MTPHSFSGLDPVIQEKFKKAFRKQVFRLVYEGYVLLMKRNKDYSKAIEEEISHDLAGEIEKFSEDGNPPRWVQKFSVQCEKPISPHGEIGRSRPRLDIWIRSGARPYYPKFVFEAKRLRHVTRPADYFGDEGVECFWNGTGYPVNTAGGAGMLGYIQDEDVTHWVVWLEERFERRREVLHICEGSGWEPAVQINELPHTFCTHHQPNANEKPIVLFHLLLSFC